MEVRYKTAMNGEWITPVRKGYKLGCCDCGLVHVINFKLVGKKNKKIMFQAFRDNRSTAAMRRKKKQK